MRGQLPCATALDALTAAMARLAPSAPLGVWLLNLDRAIVVAGLVLTAILFRRRSGSWLAGIAAGAGLAAVPGMRPSISTLDPLIFLAATAGLLALTGPGGWRSRSAIAWIALTLLVATPVLGFLAPALPPPVSATTSGCVLPFQSPAAIREWLGQVAAVVRGAGAYAIALALLGAYGAWRRTTEFSMLALIALVGPLRPSPSFTGALAPIVIVFWMSIAGGLGEIVRACRARRGGIVGAVVLSLALPLLQIANRPPPAPAPLYGIDRLSLADMRRLIARLPDGSVLVDDGEPMTATLLRATGAAWRAMDKRLGLINADPAAIAAAVTRPDTHVFVFPLAQSRLPLLGVRLRAANLPGVEGLAEVDSVVPCERLRARWVDVSGLFASRAHVLSVVDLPSGDDNEALIFVAIADAARRPAARDVPPPSPFRFELATFSRLTPEEAAQLAARLQADGAPPDFGAAAPFLERVGVSRRGTGPLVLSLELNDPPLAVIARGPANSPPAGLVCPAFPYSSAALRIWQ